MQQKYERQGFLNINEKKIVLDQVTFFLTEISSIKDEFLKDREKRNLFLSYSGLRLEQVTRDYFEKIEEINPNSYIEKMAAFESPLNAEGYSIIHLV